MTIPSYSSCLVDMLKSCPDAFLDLIIDLDGKTDIRTIVNKLKLTHALYADHITNLIISLMSKNDINSIREILDTLEPHEKNLVYSNFIKKACIYDQAYLAAIINPKVSSFFDIFFTFHSEPACVAQFIDSLILLNERICCVDDCLRSFLVSPQALPIVMNMTLPSAAARILAPHVHIEYQIQLILKAEPIERAILLNNVYNVDLLKKVLPLIIRDDFKVLVLQLLRLNSNLLIYLLMHCSDEQFSILEEINQFCDAFSNIIFFTTPIREFVTNLSPARREKLYDSKAFLKVETTRIIIERLEKKSKIESSYAIDLQRIHPLILLACPISTALLARLSPHMREDQIGDVVYHGSRELVERMLQHLISVESPKLKLFLEQLPTDQNDKFTVINVLNTFHENLRNLVEETMAAKTRVIQGTSNDDDKHIMIQAIVIRNSSSFKTIHSYLAQALSSKLDDDLYIRFINLCKEVKQLKFSEKKVTFTG